MLMSELFTHASESADECLRRERNAALEAFPGAGGDPDLAMAYAIQTLCKALKERTAERDMYRKERDSCRSGLSDNPPA